MTRVKKLGLCAAVAALACASSPALAGQPWIAAWTSPTFPAIPVKIAKDVRAYVDQTVRQVLRVETDGTRLRVKLTNELGTTEIKVGTVHVALSDPKGVIDPKTDHVLTFSGAREAVLRPGAALYSDPVDFKVPAFSKLAISVWYPEAATPAAHLANVLISGPGDVGAQAVMPEAREARAPALASEVEVQGSTATKVLVAVGDSITEGAASTPGADKDWPSQFALRLAAAPGGRCWSVVNEGISGNRILHDGAGPNLLARFDRDVLDVPGVKDVVLLEGINDIGWGDRPDNLASADELIAAYKQLIERAHERGLKIYAGTLTPFAGAVYYTPSGEEKREKVNAWIRTSGAFDGVIEFEPAVKDPAHPTRYLAIAEHGDHLHPNDEGYRRMAAAVDTSLFTRDDDRSCRK
jgi:lysophospholipase L1-like esterase